MHKGCKITIGNNSVRRDLYLSCSDIYFRRGTSTNVIFFSTQTQTHTPIQWEEFHIFRGKQSHLSSPRDSRALLPLRGPNNNENSTQADCYLVYSMIAWGNSHLFLSTCSERTQTESCTPCREFCGKCFVSKQANDDTRTVIWIEMAL